MNSVPSYHVLIVDDNPEFVKSLKSLIFDVAGPVVASVLCAYNGEDGLTLMRDHLFHFVFLDINMPGIDGVSATRFATFEYNKPETQIIAISFHTEQTFRLQMTRAGASKYLAKDEIDAEQLAEIFGI
jgi:two-component system, NarL family, sensor histidine kinase BarA